jgi:CheY-like chemotaxis protein
MNEKTPLDGWLVLVVDDEFDSREVATMMLERAGATVITAEHGKEALTVITKKRPNFILSDLSMPVMDGWQLMYALNQNSDTIDIPVIALTAHAMRGDRERAMAAGFRNYINKPLDAKKFMSQLLVILVEQPEFIGRFD